MAIPIPNWWFTPIWTIDLDWSRDLGATDWDELDTIESGEPESSRLMKSEFAIVFRVSVKFSDTSTQISLNGLYSGQSACYNTRPQHMRRKITFFEIGSQGLIKDNWFAIFDWPSAEMPCCWVIATSLLATFHVSRDKVPKRMATMSPRIGRIGRIGRIALHENCTWGGLVWRKACRRVLSDTSSSSGS